MTICDQSETDRSLGTGVRSVHENGRFREWEHLWLRSPSRKKAVFMDGKVFSRSASKKMGIFLAEKVEKQKETPSKGCLRRYLVMRCPIRSGMTHYRYRHDPLSLPA
jgi:hypothetical protein